MSEFSRFPGERERRRAGAIAVFSFAIQARFSQGNSMKPIAVFFALLATLPVTRPAFAQDHTLDESIRARSDASWEMARKIWEWAEVGYHETRSAALLADSLQAAGFQVERGVAGIPTAFIATVGSGKPVIAILGEYDALPGLAQESVPERKPRPGLRRARLRPPPLRRRLGFRQHRAGRATEVGSASGHASLLRLPGRGRGQRQGVSRPRRALQRLRRRASLASGEHELGRRRGKPGADRRQVPVPGQERACRRRPRARPVGARRRRAHQPRRRAAARAHARLHANPSRHHGRRQARPMSYPISPRRFSTSATRDPTSSASSIHACSNVPRPAPWRPRPISRPSTWAASSRSSPTKRSAAWCEPTSCG